jgi:hypothetical protein
MDPELPRDPPMPRPAGEPPSIGQHLKWSVALIAACVVIAKLAIPLMRWLGLEPR